MQRSIGGLKLWLVENDHDDMHSCWLHGGQAKLILKEEFREHNIILYYFGSRVQLVHIMFRATILPSLITFHHVQCIAPVLSHECPAVLSCFVPYVTIHYSGVG